MFIFYDFRSFLYRQCVCYRPENTVVQKILVCLRKQIPVTNVIVFRSTVDKMWAKYFYRFTELKRSLKRKKTVNVFCVGIVSTIVTCVSGHNVSLWSVSYVWPSITRVQQVLSEMEQCRGPSEIYFQRAFIIFELH